MSNYLKATFFFVFFLIISVFIAYSNSLNGIWALDDVLINQPISFEQVFKEFGARKISYLSFVLNQKIGPHEPVNFRIVNIFIHLLNSFLLYFIIILTLKLPQFKDKLSNHAHYIAALSAIIFALHPLNINAVAYIIQRMASLSAFFVLLSLIMFIFAINKQYSSIKKAVFYLIALVSFVLAVLSKENAVVAIPLIILYDFIFLSPINKDAFRKRALAVVLLSFIAIGIISLKMPLHIMAFDVIRSFLDISTPISYKAWTATDVYWSPLEHILTEFRVICRYLFLFIMPLPENLVFDWWGYPVSTGLLTPITTLFSIIFILGILTFSIVFLRRYVFLSFGILWYFIAISLESFIAIGSDLYFEHRNYLPLTGFIAGIVMQIFDLTAKYVFSKKYFFWAILLMLSTMLGFLTYERNFIWQKPIVFWADAVKKTDNNLRANLALANCYLNAGDFKNAEIYYINTFNKAYRDKRPFYTEDALYQLGFMNLTLGSIEESSRVIEKFEKILPDSYKLLILKGFNCYLNGDYRCAIYHYNNARQEKIFYEKNKAVIHTLIGDVYRDMGNIDKSLNNYQKALSINAFYAPAYHGIAKLSILKKDFSKAEELLLWSIKLNPSNFQAFSDMSYLLLMQQKRLKEALYYAEKAISMNPPSYKPYLIIAVLEIIRGNYQTAEGYLNTARMFKAPYYLLLFNKAWAYSLIGDTAKEKATFRELIKEKNVPQHILDVANRRLS